jgi:hypothetical protein
MPHIIKNLTNNFLLNTGRLYVLFLLLIIALKWPFFAISPVWDEAFSIFPAADFLVNHGFNYSLLLTQPGYHDGGPTASGLSLLTLVTAIVLKATGGGTWAWVILHFIQFLMAAAIGTMLTRIYSNLFDAIPAFLLAVATLVYPLMLVQFGGMYHEVPLLFFSLLAFYHFRRDRIWVTMLFLTAACLIKPSGVIAAGTLALLALYGRKPLGKRFMDALILAIPGFVVVMLRMVLVDHNLSLETSNAFGDIVKILIYRNLSVYHNYMTNVPDLTVIFGGSLLISMLFLFRGIYQRIKKGQNESDIITYNFLFIIIFSVFHFIVYAYIQTSDSHFLTRYFFYAIPSMFFVIYYTIDMILKKTKIKVTALLFIIVICLINRSGMLYAPLPYSSIAMAERSEEYINGYLVQKDYIRLIENEVAENIPIYVSLPDYYFMHYSVSRYVKKTLPNVFYIRDVIKSSGNKFIYPDHFVLVYNYPGLGGGYIKQIIRNTINRNNEFSVKILGHFEKEYFEADVFEIKRKVGRQAKP